MLKVQAGGTTNKDGKRFHYVILGLTYKELATLKEGRPIDMDASLLGLPEGTRIMIFAGETEEAMTRKIAPLVGPNTKFSVDPRLRD